MFRLCLVTDRHATGGRDLLDVVTAALRGGVDAVQLREKDLGARELLALAREVRAICTQHDAKLLINDRIDVALACGADGVQLPTNSFSVADARHLLGRGSLIGCSTHSIDEATAAAAQGADFVVFGPVFDTPAKRAYGKPVGLDALQAVTRAVAVPVLAIGGITAHNAPSVRACGATGIAAIGAFFGAASPETAARALGDA